jgi:hypothetical protein
MTRRQRTLVVSRSPDRDTGPTEGLPVSLLERSKNLFDRLPFFPSYSLIAFKNKCTVRSSRERPFLMGRSEAASFSSASMPAVERRERRYARFGLIGPTAAHCDGSGRRRRSSSKVFLTSRPGGTSGRLAETKTPALPASVGWVDASKPTTREAHASRGGSRGIDPPYIGPADRECACRRSRYRTVPLAVTSLRVRSRSARIFLSASAMETDELHPKNTTAGGLQRIDTPSLAVSQPTAHDDSLCRMARRQRTSRISG